MPKLLWVALPLVIAAVLLAVQVLRGRAPSRHAVNVATSVLLLLYVAATAGLGIYWVARQQLPVFDWHYLFGYGTVLLVSVHLVFNFPVVWRFLARRRSVATLAAPTRPPGAPGWARRGVLAALAATAATGAAFVLGLRSGRSEFAIHTPGGRGAPAGSAGLDAAVTAFALVERFHAVSSHSRAGVLPRAPAVAWGDPPAPFKRDAGAAAVLPLPPPGATRATRFDLGALADILWHTSGVTEMRGGLHLRASPSSGALFSTELYVVARALPGLAAGVWHYDPQRHALARLRDGVGSLTAGTFAGDSLHDTPVLVVATAVFRRTGHKYGDRSYRYVLADLGHALENLRVTAGALDVSTRFVAAFDEAQTAQALGVDEAEEGVLALVALGASGDALLAAAPPKVNRSPGVASGWLAPPIGAGDAARGATAVAHAATSLRAASALPAASTVQQGGRPLAQALIALPPAAPVMPDWLALIAKRRSVRRYTTTPLPLQALADVLARMNALQRPLLSAAVRVDLVAHAVAGLAPGGAYRYVPERHALAARPVPPATRAAARGAALDQDVIGDAAVVFVLSIDRTAIAADPLGPARGYRHAFLEAGLVGERVYLEAGVRGLGACAVGAFYDDEASALVGVDPAHEWVVHLAALGVKA